MKRFFNIIPGKDAACILLYGEIGEYDRVRSGDIARELIEAESASKQIDVRINSIGGDIFTGMAIFNAFRQSAADITIYIDGVAASMGSVIAACKKTKEEIRSEWFDGKDHWFTARQAVELGLVDEIYDADPVPEDSTPEQIYKIFNNRLENQPQYSDKMNLEEFRKRPLFKDCATEEDVLRSVAHLEEEAAKVPELQGKVTAFEEKERQAIEAEDKALLDAAVKDERITEAQRPKYAAILKAGRVNGMAVLKDLKPKRLVTDVLDEPGKTGAGAWEKRMQEIRDNAKR